ncbi:TPA: hypothetical protein ACPVYZ_004270 [Vibrio parahaemolyticus]|nr:hypothetical protein [Vibrio parahaemolyticus]TOH19005.1 hypothetical protein CGI90_04155 [Vibrio parahaemolyticus]HCG7330465.1 hypothetical protein [Vibrio parahaemolyticus]HCG9589044.1 hypothetical protein [Vibrio parahaemolyticus]HCH1183480.1 hypothetical protein [Vibrio parahaemolyticus]
MTGDVMSWFFVLIGVLAIDRFVLRRNKLTIENAHQVDDEKSIRFALIFFTKRSISSGKLTYTLRSKKKPSAILSFERPIIFSNQGSNSEWLTFSKASLEREAGENIAGEWVLDVKIERSCSFLNPMYKIFSTVATHTEEFDLS